MKNINNLLLATFLRKKVTYITYIKQDRCKNAKEYPFKGSQPTDGGHLILTPEERDFFITNEPLSAQWIRPYIGGYELMNGENRYCLWLKDCPPETLRSMPLVLRRLEKVSQSRLSSKTKSVRDFSKYPALFTQDRQPDSSYLAFPEVSSENRRYIPIGFLNSGTICSNKLQIIPNASLYLFGVLMSEMHMTWTKTVCGRLKSDYSYSPSVYNSYPFPVTLNDKQIKGIETAAQKVLDSRAEFPGSSLADLYDPLTMPPSLVKAHSELDKAVDLAYRPQPFITEAKRMEFLFELYEKYTADLFPKEKSKRKANV